MCVCVCVFSANNFAMQHKRKTIAAQDVLDAMKEMEFERFVEPLKKSLDCKLVHIDFSVTSFTSRWTKKS